MRRIAILLIILYQRFLSPYKGFRCAYGALHGKGSCSQIVKNIIRQYGLFSGWPKIKQQFQDCKIAYIQLQQDPDLDKDKKKKKKSRCDHFDCPSPCDCVGSGRGGGGGGGGLDCDAPCDFDLPCDCSP